MVVVDVWVALACVSFSSTAKRTERKEENKSTEGLKKAKKAAAIVKKGDGSCRLRKRTLSMHDRLVQFIEQCKWTIIQFT